ncbi:MAG: hypothetical protein KJ955_03795 [Nanoarchaeota archaeon]|nr:hypothetical protein [Nanoarchaeota archaeon]
MSRQDADKLAKAGISTKAFGEDPVSDLFGWDKNYGQLLSDYGIKVVPLYLLDAGHVKKQKQAVCRGLWVISLNYHSAILGDGSLFYSLGRVFGVREQPEAASQGVRSTPQRAEISTGNAGLVTPSLEQVLAVAGEFTVGPNMEALQEKLASLYRKAK